MPTLSPPVAARTMRKVIGVLTAFTLKPRGADSDDRHDLDDDRLTRLAARVGQRPPGVRAVEHLTLPQVRCIPPRMRGVRWTGGRAARAPLEHHCGCASRSEAGTAGTRGLSGTPISANEHRSSTGNGRCDQQVMLLIASVQVKDLLLVRRQGLEPRTRGLRVRCSAN
jgi:hypothetical protein